MRYPQSSGFRIAIALAGVALATGIRSLLDPLLGDGLAFAPYLVASTVVAWAAGGWASILALFLGILTGSYLFITPRGSLLIPHPAHLLEAAGCAVVGVTATYFVAKLRGVQQRAEAEIAQRQRAEERLKLAQSAGGIGVWDWDASRDETFWSDTMWNLYGARPVEDGRVVGESWFSRLHPEDRGRVEVHIGEFFPSAESHFRDEYRILRPDGVTRWVECLAKIERDAAGLPLRMFGVNVDVTARKEAELALLEANRRKDEFLATLAHELRNPLAPIANAVEIFKCAQGDDELMEQARSMLDRQVSQMVRLIDDLLDLSRITRNKLTLRKEASDLVLVIGHAVEAVRPLVESRRHDLRLSLPSEPTLLHADQVRLAQVFGNLLTNACKYTEEGGRIWLDARRQGGEAVITIRDEGIGIPAEKLGNVFEMFTQLDRSPERSQGGLGIGLALARRLVEMHEGTVTAYSDGPGQGSEFSVRLPLAGEIPAAAEGEAEDDGLPVHPRRILVVDDNHDAVDSLAMLLKLAGHDVDTARDGQTALEAAARRAHEVILLDIGMPHLNGYDVARQIRRQPFGREVVLVALTGWGQEEDRRRSGEAGFDHHFVKPVDHGKLRRLLASLPPPGGAGGAGGDHRSP